MCYASSHTNYTECSMVLTKRALNRIYVSTGNKKIKTRNMLQALTTKKLRRVTL